MPRGRHLWGPGFWKRGTGWVPGSGGFRGGAYFYDIKRPFWDQRPRCYWFRSGYPPSIPPFGAEEPAPEDEISMLKEEKEALKKELEEVENKLVELKKVENSNQKPGEE